MYTAFDLYLQPRNQSLLDGEERRDGLHHNRSLLRIREYGKWSATVCARVRITTLLCNKPFHAVHVLIRHSPFRFCQLLLQLNRRWDLPIHVEIIYFN